MTKKVSRFEDIVSRVCDQRGGIKGLRKLLPDGIRSAKQLKAVGDDRFLPELTKLAPELKTYLK